MNFKKTWKRFFSLNRHHAEGFTLVELIVVIAILAILGGVAVPAYSGYVEKANKQADISLASEVAHALTLGYYSGTITNGGYVVLSADSAPQTGGEGIDAAMIATFGDGWEKNTILKYDGWNAKLFSAAAQQNGIGAVGESGYIQGNNATSLVGKVQGLINPAVDLIGTKLESDPNNVYNKMNMYLGSDFETFATNSKNGISVVDDGTHGNVYAIEVTSGSGDFTATDGKNYNYVSQEQLSNLMTLYVADGVGNTANNADTKIDYASFLENSIANGDYITSSGVQTGFNTMGLTMTEYLAVNYAMYSALAEYDSSYAEALTAVDNGLASATDMGSVLSAMNNFWSVSGGLSEDDINYVTGAFGTDMDAIVATLGAAGDVADDYYNSIGDLTDSTFFSSDEITGALNSFIAGASSMSGLTNDDLTVIAGAGEGDVVIIIGKTGIVSNSIGN